MPCTFRRKISDCASKLMQGLRGGGTIFISYGLQCGRLWHFGRVGFAGYGFCRIFASLKHGRRPVFRNIGDVKNGTPVELQTKVFVLIISSGRRFMCL